MQKCNSVLYSLTNIQKLLGHCKKESLNYSYFHFIKGQHSTKSQITCSCILLNIQNIEKCFK
jgi:hypothetical protein